MRFLARRPGTVVAEVMIRRPVQDVYGFYQHFANLPRIVGDVIAVEPVNGTTYRWFVAGPLGARTRLLITVTEQRDNQLLRYETRGPAPLRARWRLEFDADGDPAIGPTRVREQLTMPLGGLGRALLALVGKFPEREVGANLSRLKDLLEAGTAVGRRSGSDGPR
jgi:uncharacterized membrane protein